MAYTEAQRDAVARYQAKTYRNTLLKLRVEEDADIIASMDAAKEKGITHREWLRELFEQANK